MATRGERRRKLRLASESKGTTSALSSSTPPPASRGLFGTQAQRPHGVQLLRGPVLRSRSIDPLRHLDSQKPRDLTRGERGFRKDRDDANKT